MTQLLHFLWWFRSKRSIGVLVFWYRYELSGIDRLFHLQHGTSKAPNSRCVSTLEMKCGCDEMTQDKEGQSAQIRGRIEGIPEHPAK